VDRFAERPKDHASIWRAVGYYTFFRFMGNAIARPEEYGIVDELDPFVGTSLLGISNVLKILMMVSEDKGGPFVGMNGWITDRHAIIKDYLKDVINVADAEEELGVNKYAQLARRENASIVIQLSQIANLHKYLKANAKEITEVADDPLNLLLRDLDEVPLVANNDTQEAELKLQNKFPPQLSKLEKKKDLLQNTVDDAIKVLRKIPGFSGETFLEIFVRMKLHCKKIGDEKMAVEVNQVIANLQNLVKYKLVSPEDGFNGFLKNISEEIVARGKRRTEHLKEIDRLTTAIKELDGQKLHMEEKMKDYQVVLDSLRKQSAQGFVSKTKKFKYKDLSKAKVIADSEIPPHQQGKVIFEITHTGSEEFDIKGRIKNIPGFSRNFQLSLVNLLDCKDAGKPIFDTEKGLELYVDSTLRFLNTNFYSLK